MSVESRLHAHTDCIGYNVLLPCEQFEEGEFHRHSSGAFSTSNIDPVYFLSKGNAEGLPLCMNHG